MSRLVNIYLAAHVQQARLTKLMESVFAGFWLGVLTPSDLEAVDDAYYVGIGRKATSPIDYANPDYNKRGLFTWERAAIESHFAPKASIALLAAGGGREVLALRQLSFSVDAWECQPEFIDAANTLLVAEGYEPSVSYAARNRAPAGSDSYDALIIGWGTYTLIRGCEQRIALLRDLRGMVDNGSPLFLSFFARRPRDRQLRVTVSVGNLVRQVLGRDVLEMGDSLDPNFVHWFDEDEIRSELAAGGFELTYFRWAPYGHAVAVAR
jgi:hypothetical protein